MIGLKRLVLDYRTGELVVRCLYRSRGIRTLALEPAGGRFWISPAEASALPWRPQRGVWMSLGRVALRLGKMSSYVLLQMM
jgi:hypothetical protein